MAVLVELRVGATASAPLQDPKDGYPYPDLPRRSPKENAMTAARRLGWGARAPTWIGGWTR